MSENKNILITGGAGFIGSHVVRIFVNKYPNYNIYNLDALTYAGNLENLKDLENASNYKFLRGDITNERYINDEPTVEIDYSGMHINLVYDLLGRKERYAGTDPYAISLKQYKINQEDTRRLAKQLMLMALNASGERAAISAFRSWLVNEHDIRQGLPDLKDVTIKPIIEALKNKHKHIQQMFFSGAAKGLMTLDSLILEYTIEECVKHNVPVLPVHDSIIVQRRHKEYAKQLMEDAYNRIMKAPIGITTSPSSYGLGSLRPQDYKKRAKRYQASLRRWKDRKAISHYQKS